MSSFLYANAQHISFSNFRFTFREGMPAWKVYDYMSVLVAYLRQWECVEAKHLSDIFIILRLMQKITTLALTLLWRYIPGFVLSHISFYLCYLQDTDIIPALSNSSKLNTGHPNWRMRWGWLDKLTLTGRGLSYSPSAGWQKLAVFRRKQKKRCFWAFYQTLDSFVWIWSKEKCLAF